MAAKHLGGAWPQKGLGPERRRAGQRRGVAGNDARLPVANRVPRVLGLPGRRSSRARRAAAVRRDRREPPRLAGRCLAQGPRLTHRDRYRTRVRLPGQHGLLGRPLGEPEACFQARTGTFTWPDTRTSETADARLRRMRRAPRDRRKLGGENSACWRRMSEPAKSLSPAPTVTGRTSSDAALSATPHNTLRTRAVEELTRADESPARLPGPAYIHWLLPLTPRFQFRPVSVRAGLLLRDPRDELRAPRVQARA
jgi:hypothetical protein